jgi:hemin uptake protein HemP
MGMIITLAEQIGKHFIVFHAAVDIALSFNMLVIIYNNEYPVSVAALDIRNENRYRSHMHEYERQPQQRPASSAKLPPNDKTGMWVTSQALLGTANELIIQHDGREYRLRLTQNGKLILTA